MKTPYIPHTFGEEVDRKLGSRRGWLTAGVASSISWPSFDVCVTYAGDEYFLRGSERDGKPSPPGITIACDGAGGADKALAKIYRFTSILSWFEGGYCRPAGANVGDFKPLSVADIAKQAGTTGGAISGHAEMTVTGAGPGFGVHIVDVEVDKKTGATKVTRYTVVQDVGKAIHPQQVEGQFQGGAVQGCGWALNEEYIYGDDGRMQNPSFLDYRLPVASDLPMIDTVIVEVPNPKHPYGLRGVGEVPVSPTLGAIANAVTNAIGVRPHEVPMSPPRLLKLIESARSRSAA